MLINQYLFIHVDLGKVRDLVKGDIVKKDVHNAKIKNVDDKIPN